MLLDITFIILKKNTLTKNDNYIIIIYTVYTYIVNNYKSAIFLTAAFTTHQFLSMDLI